MPTVTDAMLSESRQISSSTLHEAYGRQGALPSKIKPVSDQMRLCGRALPVQCAPGDNLRLHHAIYEAMPGDVLVADTGDGDEFGYWGEIMTVAALERGIAGLVIVGGVRDVVRLAELRFPTFAGRVCLRGTSKKPELCGDVGRPVTIGGVSVQSGDLIVGDTDGVLVVRASDAGAVIDRAKQRDRDEHDIMARLRTGETTLAIYGLPPVDGIGL